MEESSSELLSINQINENLGKCNGWNIEDSGKSIRKDFQFGSFKEVMDFANRIVEISEEERHYPDLRIYGSKNLEVKFTTGTNGLTLKDFDIAQKIDCL